MVLKPTTAGVAHHTHAWGGSISARADESSARVAAEREDRPS